jgi:hypothetical protein
MLEKLKSQKSSSQWAGKLYKGTRKQNGKFGSDLDEYFRFEPFSNVARIALSKIEGAKKDNNDDVLIPYLDVFLASDRLDSTFKVSMKIWDGTGLAQTCDGTTITHKREEYKDSLGCRTRIMTCHRPCAIASQPLGSLCPNKCKQEGELMFYVPQLINAGVELPVLLTVHAWSDLFSLLQCLEAIEGQYGSIKSSPFPCGTFGNIIPLILRRNKTKIRRPQITNSQRTGKKSLGEAWAATLSVNPMWRQAYLAWQQAVNVRALGYQPSASLLELTGVVHVNESPLMLPPSLPQTINERPLNWQPKAIQWAILEGLKPETVDAIASRSNSYDEFVGLVDKAIAIAWAIKQGIDEATAKAMLKMAPSLEQFKKEVEELLNTVDVEALDF